MEFVYGWLEFAMIDLKPGTPVNRRVFRLGINGPTEDSIPATFVKHDSNGKPVIQYIDGRYEVLANHSQLIL